MEVVTNTIQVFVSGKKEVSSDEGEVGRDK